MLKIILKNLWNRRRQNAWIFAELIIVTILTWVILDSTIIGLYNLNQPAGYDVDRLVRISIDSYPRESKRFDWDHMLPDVTAKDQEILIEKMRQLPEVEMVIRDLSPINGNSYIIRPLNTNNPAIDTIAGNSFYLRQIQGEKYCSAYGFEAAEGSPSIEEIESMMPGENDFVITESIDRTYWPDRRGVNDKYFYYINRDDTIKQRVVGIIKDFKPISHIATNAVCLSWIPFTPNMAYNQRNFTLRLKDGVNASKYVRENLNSIYKDLRVGNFYIKSVSSQSDIINKNEDSKGVTSRRYLYILVASLFLINLIVGVTGCVWLQTGKRVSEIGILRSYGATRRRVMKMLLGESIALATAAFGIGDLIFMQYAIKEGFYIDNFNLDLIPIDSWVNNFGEHFVIVSLIVYAVIVLCAVIGTYFPARHVSKIEPVDALRDE